MTIRQQAIVSLSIAAGTTTLLLSYLLLLGCSSQYLILDSHLKGLEKILHEIGIVLFLCLLAGLLGSLDAGGQWMRLRGFRYHYTYELLIGLVMLAFFIALLYPFITRDLVIKGTNERVFSEFRELRTLANNYFDKSGESYDGLCESQSFKSAEASLTSINTHEGALCASERRVRCRARGAEFAISISNSFAGSEHVYLCLDADHANPVGSELPIEGTRCEEI